jgi:hypothetical protein
MVRIRSARAIGADAGNEARVATKAIKRPARKMAAVVGRDAAIAAERKVAKNQAEGGVGPAGGSVVMAPNAGSLAAGSLAAGSLGVIERPVARLDGHDVRRRATCASRSSISWSLWT